MLLEKASEDWVNKAQKEPISDSKQKTLDQSQTWSSRKILRKMSNPQFSDSMIFIVLMKIQDFFGECQIYNIQFNDSVIK